MTEDKENDSKYKHQYVNYKIFIFHLVCRSLYHSKSSLYKLVYIWQFHILT